MAAQTYLNNPAGRIVVQVDESLCPIVNDLTKHYGLNRASVTRLSLHELHRRLMQEYPKS